MDKLKLAEPTENGNIKFNCNWIEAETLPDFQIVKLNLWRSKLYDLHLIGANDNGIGYGNLSERIGNSGQFIISGSATGNLPFLDGRHYTHVLNYDFNLNTLTCEGPIKASSESLTHAAIYETKPLIKGVIHVHNLALWQSLIDKVPTTAREIEYGTPEMAAEMTRMLKDDTTAKGKIIVMGGHTEGIITCGVTLDEAGETLMKYYLENTTNGKYYQ